MTALPRIPARALPWLLAATLLLAQLLGLMHGVVHVPQAHLDSPVDHEFASAHASHDHGDHDHSATVQDEHGSGWLESLFSSHGDDSDCRLFDQASHGQAAPVLPMLSLPLVLSSVAFDISRGEALARWAALFDARGPPSSR
ncbi:hypothetical protein [Polaromonas aquatica]|uniref:hypothetical protein n=1 Tax=Polaromonas aquatica TaxID=332657 RepID=UPI003D65E443